MLIPFFLFLASVLFQAMEYKGGRNEKLGECIGRLGRGCGVGGGNGCSFHKSVMKRGFAVLSLKHCQRPGITVLRGDLRL